MDDATTQFWVTLLVPLLGMAATYGGLRYAVKQVEVELPKKASVDHVSTLETKAKDLADSMAALQAARSKADADYAALHTSHHELKKKHDEGMGETRGRVSALENKTNNMEQVVTELRTQLSFMNQTIARVEANVTNLSTCIESVRRDLLEAVRDLRRDE